MLGLVWRFRVVAVIASLAALGAICFSVAGSHARVVSRVEFTEPSGKVLAGFFEGLPKESRYDLKLIKAQVASGPHRTCGSSAPSFWRAILGKLNPVSVAHAQSGNCTSTTCSPSIYWADGSPLDCDVSWGVSPSTVSSRLTQTRTRDGNN